MYIIVDNSFSNSFRNSKFKQGLSKLKEELMRVNMYAREANELAQELRVDAQYSVTLQIPSSNLSPNRRVSNTCSYT